MIKIVALCGIMSLGIVSALPAQPVAPVVKAKKAHSIYFSWGYNGEWYTHTNVHIKQDALGNDYTMQSVRGHDHKGWDDHFFRQQLTIPQYNYRLGYVLDEARGIGIEINFDHTKFIIADEQDIKVTGRFNDHIGDTTIHFSEATGSYWYLNNGANFFLINLVKRWKLYGTHSSTFRLDALGKAGIGPVVPHVSNRLFGNYNVEGFQFGGWNTGIEGDLKATFYKYVYLEYGAKFDYARYSNLAVYEGRARQAFGTFEMILSLGVNIPTSGGHTRDIH